MNRPPRTGAFPLTAAQANRGPDEDAAGRSAVRMEHGSRSSRGWRFPAGALPRNRQRTGTDQMPVELPARSVVAANLPFGVKVAAGRPALFVDELREELGSGETAEIVVEVGAVDRLAAEEEQIRLVVRHRSGRDVRRQLAKEGEERRRDRPSGRDVVVAAHPLFGPAGDLSEVGRRERVLRSWHGGDSRKA